MSSVKAEDASDVRQDNIVANNGAAEAAFRARLARKRTKTGCLTCRRRRIKCDEVKPICRNCQKSRRQCEGYNQRVVFKPADFQYMGPHGAATITFHTGMLAGTTGVNQDAQMSFGQPELRPRGTATQGYSQGYPLYPGSQQYSQISDQKNQTSMVAPGLAQSFQLPYMLQPYSHPQPWDMNAQSQAQTQPSMGIFDPNPKPDAYLSLPAGHIPPHGLLQRPEDLQMSFVNTDQPPVYPAPYGHQAELQAPLQTWLQGTMPAQLQSTSPVWIGQPGQELPASAEVTPHRPPGPSRVTISQTKLTTTVQQEWPASDYTPHPELSKPIAQEQKWAQPQPQPTKSAHLLQSRPRFMASQLYEQSEEPGYSSPQPLDTVTNSHSEDTGSSRQSASPARLLEEAAVELQDDDYYDVDQDDDVELEISTKALEQKRQGVLKSIVDLAGLHTSVLDMRGFDTFIYDGILDTYRSEWAANPLKNPATARVFAHFITATGPLLTIFTRQTRVSDTLLHEGPLPLNQQGLWTYIMPMAALHHQGLLQAILAISSLHIAKLQRASETPSFKHYGYALKRIHRSVRNPEKRHSAETLAATLLLGYYEIVAANHTNWNTHLAGAKQLVIETDFLSMTAEFRRMKAEKAMRDYQNPYYTTDMPPLPYNYQPQDNLLDQIPDIDEGVVSIFAGRGLKYDEYGRIIDEHNTTYARDGSALDLIKYETLKDLYWWYCKQDVYQSIISGNPLMMDFSHWTDCPPRAPLNKADAVYGSYDHLIILLGRVSDFTTRDRGRKLKVMQANGGVWKPAPGMQLGTPPGAQPSQGPPQSAERPSSIPGQSVPQTGSAKAPPPMPFFGMAPPPPGGRAMPASYQPSQGPYQQAPTPGASPSDGSSDLYMATEQAIQEWNQIKAAAEFFASQLGPTFQPLGPEYQPPVQSPFGPTLFYRSWDISCLWAMYNLALIILIRAHPHMPPAAHMAAGIAAYQTREVALAIGSIASGVPMPPPEQPLNPNLAASLCDLAVPLFFAGIQYQAPDQRLWLVERLFDVDRRAGWATAGIIAEGCQTAWIKAAAAGRGPPHERIQKANFNDNRVYRWNSSFQSVQGRVEEEDNETDRKFVHTKATARLHWGIGIIGEENDVRLEPRQ